MEIDVDDLEANTKYAAGSRITELGLDLSASNAPASASAPSGAFDETHPTIRNFWDVLRSFDKEQKQKFLRFVTSKTRAPLRGFKDLEPPFTIANSLSGES